MKLYFLALFSMSLSLHAQVGIMTTNPNSTLTVNGSFAADYKEITSPSYAISATDHYLTYNGTINSIFTLPTIGTGINSFKGRIYKVKNVSASDITLQPSNGHTLRADNIPVSSFVIPAGAYAEIVNNTNTSGSTWDLFISQKPSNVELYGTQLLIPPHENVSNGLNDWVNHTNTGYDTGTGTDAWWVISKSSISYEYTLTHSRTSRMTIVYEYQGTPFNTSNLYPILTTGNNSSYPDTFVASFVSLINNGTSGRTRLTVLVSRIDLVGNDPLFLGSNWAGTFLLNLLLAKKIF